MAQVNQTPPLLGDPVPPVSATHQARSGARRRAKALFIGPAVVWIIALTLFPLLYVLYTSLQSFRHGERFAFIGLGNFTRIVSDANLQAALTRTLVFVAVTLTVQMTLGFGLALFLNREIRARNLLRAGATLPLFATPVAVGYLGITMFFESNGPINGLIRSLGGTGLPWLSDPSWALVSVMIIDIWQWTPFVFLVALAGLQALPEELYEAAAVDGASAFNTFRRLTLPLMTPILWLIFFLRLVEAFKVFDIPTSLTNGGPGRATEVYSLFTYRTGLRFFDHGYAAAQGILILILVMALVSLLFSRIRVVYEEQR